MKNLKFRAWDRKKQQMRVNFAVNERGYILILDVIDKYFNYVGETDGKPDLIIMQFTGLKDKNGKEIYEGDILSYFTKVKENGKVQFNSDKGQFEVFWNFGDVNSFDKHWTENELEIIGNIYENPDLNP